MYSEKRWLLSIVMTVMLAVTMLFNPAFVMAADQDGGDDAVSGTVTFVNSDGSEKEVLVSDDGFVYEEVNSDGTDMVKVLGYVGNKTTVTVPAAINDRPVKSVKIDARCPGVEGIQYDSIKALVLPQSVEYAHASSLRFLKNLESVTITENDHFKSVDGIMYKKPEEGGLAVAIYPRGKKDTTWVMPNDLTVPYNYYWDCPLESITVSSSIRAHDCDLERSFGKLGYLKEVKVAEGNPDYYSVDGVLMTNKYELDGEMKTAVAYYPIGKEDKEYTVPEEATVISDYAFASASNIEKVILPPVVDFTGYIYTGVLKTIVFTSATVPEQDQFYNYEGLRALVTWDNVEPVYPDNWTDYDLFDAYLHGMNINEWHLYDIENFSELDGREFPLGGNIWFDIDAYYGQPYYKISKTIDGEYTEAKPDSLGEWYVKICVDGTEDYTGLESEPIKIKVVEPEKNENGQYVNWILLRRTFNEPTYGEKDTPVVEAHSLYGTPVVRFIKVDDYDADHPEEGWFTCDSDKLEVGSYYFRIDVEKTDEYEGATEIYVDSDDIIEVQKANNYVWVRCEEVMEGQTPKPEIYADFGLDTAILTYTDEEGNELENVPTTAGLYRVYLTIPGTQNYYEAEDWCYFSIVKEEGCEDGHSLIQVSAEAPECTKAGNNAYWACENCGRRFSDANGEQEITEEEIVLAALGHSFTNYVSNNDATCTKDGTKTAKCDRCDETDTIVDEGSALGHTEEVIPAVPATCTEAGKTEGKKCSVCGEVLVKPEETEALGHDYQEVAGSAKAPTYTEEGKEADQKCSRCGDVIEGAVILKLQPKAVKPVVKLSAASYVYSGAVKKPTITVTAVGKKLTTTNYSVKYNTKRIGVGKHTVTVTLKNEYSGSASATFKIVPKKAAVSSAAVGKKKMTVKMKTKVGKTGGSVYQIAYKVKGTSKWKYTTTTKQSKVISKLKKGKAYQVKVRAYKTVSKVKYYGAWSKTLTTKKIK